MLPSVHSVLASEVDAWCAAPYESSDPDFGAWVEGERAWVAAHHPTPKNLWICRHLGRVIGKVDIPFDRPRGWTLWAPTVREDPAARSVMDTLLAHVLRVARERGVPSIELILDENHARFAVARGALARDWRYLERRIVVRRDLARPLPTPPSDLRVVEAGTLDPEALRALVRATGVEAGAVDEVVSDALENALSLAAEYEGRIVGLALASSRPGEDLLTEEHFGLVPDARGAGWGWSLFLHFLRAGRRAGASTYIGSTATRNLGMRRLFERVDAEEIGRRLAFRWPR